MTATISERNMAMFNAVYAGARYTSVAHEYGITPERVRQIYVKTLRILSNRDEFFMWPTHPERARTCWESIHIHNGERTYNGSGGEPHIHGLTFRMIRIPTLGLDGVAE
jgi:hypothetical protein